MTHKLHDFERKIGRLWIKLERSTVTADNKRLLREFDAHCVAEGLSVARRWKLLEYLYIFSTRHFPHFFRGATAGQIRNAVHEIECTPLAPWTKHDFKVAVRKLFKFIEWGPEALSRPGYPESVASINVRVRKKDQVRIQAADILTEEEAARLTAAASTTRDRAMVSLMYELGARVGELASMRVGSLARDQYGFVCDVNGKTGPRSVRAVSSGAVLAAWLNLHPRREDPQAPLWGKLARGAWLPLTYHYYQRLIKVLAYRACIRKRAHPHLLRHSRITHVLASGRMNEAQAKKYFGLTADSSMLATYSHLISKDANDAVLRMHGIEPDAVSEQHQAVACGTCGERNGARERLCFRCGAALSHEAVAAAQKAVQTAGETMNAFLEQPAIQGLFREWIRQELKKEAAAALRPQSEAPAGPSRAVRQGQCQEEG